MKKTFRLFCLILVCVMLMSILPVSASAAEVKFSDISEDQWYYEPIMAAAEKGIVAGNADGSYDPRGELTWAQTITFAVRLDQYKRGAEIYGSDDQTGNNWYDVYVAYAIEKGIIAAAPTAPNGVITRADAAIIFAKVLGSYKAVNTVPDGYFTDVPSTHAAYKAIYSLAEAGVCNGKDTKLFGVADSFLRSEVAAIVARMAGLVDAAILLTPEAAEAFEALEGKVLLYTPGAGSGVSTLTMGENGFFTGRYVDTRTTETGEEYPKGTIYLCNYSGRFTEVTKENDYTYALETSAISTSALPGRVVYQDGYRYISTDAHGFEQAGTFDLFLSGSYTSDMPECLLNALIIANDWGKNVPGRTADTILHNRSAHKAFIEDIPASVSAAKLFSILEGKTFTYSSGAGAWATTITFGPDGSFEGEYHDTNMGETGKEYPNGTVYTSTFYGSFGDVMKEGDCRYSLRLRYLYLHNNNLGSQNIVDGVRYVVSSAVGFEKAGYFTLYLPGMDTAKTPEPLLSWLGGLEAWGGKVPGSLPCWTLYNIGGEAPFVTYE